MRSVYHRLRQRDQTTTGGNLQVVAGWGRIWAGRTWPKVKAFIWKLISKVVVVRANLARRGIPTTMTCPACDETREHMVLGCGWTKEVWQQVLGWDVGAAARQTLEAWILMGVKPTIFTSMIARDMTWELCSFTCWSIWKARCRLAFENKQPNPTAIILEIRKAQGELIPPKVGGSRILTRVGNVAWRRPEEDDIKVNCYAS